MRYQNRVEVWRESCGFTRTELAERVGISRQSIRLIESGEVSPSTQVALRLSRVLGTTVEALFDEEVREIKARIAGTPMGAIKEPTRCFVGFVGQQWVARPAHALGHFSIQVPAQGVLESEAKVRLLQPVRQVQNTIFVSGCDIGLGLLGAQTQQIPQECQPIWFRTSNAKALSEIENGISHIAVLHLPREDADYLANSLPFATQRFAFASSEVGWVVRPDDVRGFSDTTDLASGRFRLVNRDVGSGVRTLLDRLLEESAVSSQSIPGFGDIVNGHLEVVEAVAQGRADVGIAHSAAAHLLGMKCLPIQQETSWLVVPEAIVQDRPIQILLDVLQTRSFRDQLQSMGPYEVAQTGVRYTQ